jgi:hypothetical protein
MAFLIRKCWKVVNKDQKEDTEKNQTKLKIGRMNKTLKNLE